MLEGAAEYSSSEDELPVDSRYQLMVTVKQEPVVATVKQQPKRRRTELETLLFHTNKEGKIGLAARAGRRRPRT